MLVVRVSIQHFLCCVALRPFLLHELCKCLVEVRVNILISKVVHVEMIYMCKRCMLR